MESLKLNSMLEVDKDRNCLVVSMGNSFMVECTIGKHLGVGKDRSWLVLVDNCSCNSNFLNYNNYN